MQTGFLLIDKPKGITSHDVIYKLRKITGIKKIGHAGTLDPMATGLLIVAIGRESTKQIDKFVKLDKKYVADIHLGFNTDTYDAEGEKVFVSDKQPSLEEVNKVLKQFIGKQKQIPPMYSAKKIKGKKLYELAREGKVVERPPSDIEIHSIDLIEYTYPILKIDVHVSSGTYIRSLAYDIGKVLGTGAFLEELRRTEVNTFNIDDAYVLENIKENDWEGMLLAI